MAEFVHQSLEEMIPELEEMCSIDLFTPEETKIILKKREAFEYRLRQKTKTKKAYINYIEYEDKLLELIRLRKKQNGIDFEKKAVENSIMQRINSLYRLMTVRFPEDLSLWEKNIEFCIRTRQLSYVSRLYAKMLRIHSHREDIVVKAARFERSTDGNANPDAARELLLNGQRVLPESEIIFLEMFQLELDLATTVIERKKILKIGDDLDDDDELAQTQSLKERPEFNLARIVQKKALEMFSNNPGFHMKMLNVCSKFPYAAHQQKAMAAELKKLYSKDADVWNGLAMCELNHFKSLSAVEKVSASDRCLQTLVEGLRRCPTESMWSHTLWGHLTVLDLRHGQHQQAVQILASTLKLFQQAISRGKLSEELFEHLIQMLTDMNLPDDACAVAEKAVEAHPTSSGLWLARLRNMAERSVDLEAVLKVFRVALSKLEDESCWPLWQFALHLCALKDNSCLESMMEQACRSISPKVCCPAKEWSLAWTYRTGGIKKARQVYKSLKCLRPTSVEFYRRYIHMENCQPEPKLDLMRAAFEEALAEFGKTEQDVWLNYLEMERRVARDASKAGRIQERALLSLRPDLKESFIRTNAMIGLAA